MKMRMTEENRKLLMTDLENERVAESKVNPDYARIADELSRPIVKGYILVNRRTADWVMDNLMWYASNANNEKRKKEN